MVVGENLLLGQVRRGVAVHQSDIHDAAGGEVGQDVGDGVHLARTATFGAAVLAGGEAAEVHAADLLTGADRLVAVYRLAAEGQPIGVGAGAGDHFTCQIVHGISPWL